MKQKLRLKSTKGYLQIDIAFAILIFFLLFLTIYTMNKDNNKARENIIFTKELDMSARDICMVLISTPGVPMDWEINDINNVKVFGLKNNSSNSLDVNKISHFNTTNYFTIKNKFDMNHYINVNIVGLNTTTKYLDFGVDTTETNVKTSSYNCYAIYNSEPVQVTVEAWE